MADEQEKNSDDMAPDDSSTAPAPEAAKKPDLRVSSHQDLGVNVSRDLNAGGWLARGDRSNMSKLSFSVRAKPRDQLDPELQALRNPASTTRDSRSAAAMPPAPEPPAAATPARSAPEPSAPPATNDKPDGLLGRLGRLFGGE